MLYSKTLFIFAKRLASNQLFQSIPLTNTKTFASAALIIREIFTNTAKAKWDLSLSNPKKHAN